MAIHNQRGKAGEQMAADYLVREGFSIVHRNWRYGHLEVDLIALKGDVLHFIEVKLRRSNRYGYPEQGAGKQKIRFLMRAADQYLYIFPQYKKICFDILAITAPEQGPVAYFFIQDVYP